VPGVGGLAMRFTGNFFSEGAHLRGGRSNHTFLVPLVACAVGATASGAVVLSLMGPPVPQSPGPSSVPPRAIVRSAGPSGTETAKNQPAVETPLPSAVTAKVSDRDEPVTQTVAEQQAEVHDQQSRKHSQQHTRERYSQGRFRPFPRFSSRRDELTSGAR